MIRMKEKIGTLFIAVAMIIVAVILGNAWTKSHPSSSNLITVTGLAEKNFSSDLISWRCSFSRKSQSIKDAYKILEGDAEMIKSYIRKKGVADNEFVFSAIEINKEYRSVVNDKVRTEVFDGYRLVQNVNIQSKDVEKIENVSRSITELIDKDIELNSMPPQYFYTRLAELKIEMLAKATSDARVRAEQIAQNAGSKLNGLKSANMGVFQITAQNSSENFTYGGVFNTASKDKTASITVKLEFAIN
jgi:hypothetical protein